MPGKTGPTLDDEGIPDLMGPLPEKERTGDPQEGLAPPGDRPHADEWGTTGAEMAAGEPLDLRVAHENPDIGETDPVDDIARDLGLATTSTEANDPTGSDSSVEVSDLIGHELVGDELFADDEKDMVASAPATDSMEGQSAEEAAMHIVEP